MTYWDEQAANSRARAESWRRQGERNRVASVESRMADLEADNQRLREAIRVLQENRAAPVSPSPDVEGRCTFNFNSASGIRCQAQRGHPIHHGVSDGPDFAHEFRETPHA